MEQGPFSEQEDSVSVLESVRLGRLHQQATLDAVLLACDLCTFFNSNKKNLYGTVDERRARSLVSKAGSLSLARWYVQLVGQSNSRTVQIRKT